MTVIAQPPTAFSGLSLYVRSDLGVFSDSGATTAATNGGNVAVWQDQSGNANHLTAITAPTFKTGQLGSYPSVNFNSEYMNNPYLGEIGTALIIYQYANSGNQAGSANRTMMGAKGNASNMGAYFLKADSSGVLNGRSFTRGLNGDNYGGEVGTEAINAQSDQNIWSIWGGTNTGVIGTSGGTLTQFKWDVPVGSATLGGAPMPISSPAYVGCGWYGGGTTDMFAGDIVAICIWNVPLTTVQYQSVVAYFTAMYATLNYQRGFSYFCFEAPNYDDRLFIQHSSDLQNWVCGPVNYVPTSSGAQGVRDPSVLKTTYFGGSHVVAHTKNPAQVNFSYTATSFVVAGSSDGVNFTEAGEVDCSAVLSGASYPTVWAPEWFVDSDGSVHVFVAISATGENTDTGFQVYEVHPLTTSLSGAWSTPVVVSGTSLPTNMIDPFMVKIGGTYFLWYKNESTKYLEIVSSTSLTSGYTQFKSGDWAGFNSSTGQSSMEGPSLLNMGGSNWTLFMDANGNGIYSAKSTNNWASWTTPALISPEVPIQHGTVIRDTPFATAFTAQRLKTYLRR